MKKPVKVTGAELEAIIARRNKKTITVTKKFQSGTVYALADQVERFADDNGVSMDEVRIVNNTSWGCSNLSTKRVETDKEFRARVRYEEDSKYERASYRYKTWEREQAAKQAEIDRLRRYTDSFNQTSGCACVASCPCRRG